MYIYGIQCDFIHLECIKKLTFWKWMISLCNLVSRAQKWRKIAQKIQILYFCSRNTVNHLCMQWLPVIITRGSVQFNVIVSQPWDLGMDYVQINVQEKVKTNPLISVSREIHFPQFWCRQIQKKWQKSGLHHCCDAHIVPIHIANSSSYTREG